MLLAALGIKSAEVLGAEALSTLGSRALRRVNVSSRRLACFFSECNSVIVLISLINACMQHHRRQSVLHAPNAASQRNPAKSVVAVAVVLGSETAEVVVTPSLVTRGTMACSRAEHGQNRRQSSSSS